MFPDNKGYFQPKTDFFACSKVDSVTHYWGCMLIHNNDSARIIMCIYIATEAFTI